MIIWPLQDRLRSTSPERQTVLLARAFFYAGQAATVVTFRPGWVLAPTLGGVRHLTLQAFDTGLNGLAPGLVRAARVAAPDAVLLHGTNGQWPRG